jgi:hypothetical protein
VELLKNPVWWIKWIATFALIIGAFLTADGVTTYNKVFFFVGSFGWTIVGLAWKDYSIILVNGICASIYFTGWFK